MMTRRSVFLPSALGAALLLVSCDEITVTITGPTDGQLFRGSGESGVVVVGTVSEPVNTISATLDGNPFVCIGPVSLPSPSPSPSLSFNRLCHPVPVGQHVVNVHVTGASGRTGSAAVRFVVDAPLKVQIASPTPGQRITTSTASLVFSASGQTGAVSFTCQLDGSPASGCTSPRVLSGLSDGLHTLTVTGRDAIDTVSSSVSIVVDTGHLALLPAKQVTLGLMHTCALLQTDKVRCWGAGRDGALGYGNENDVGARTVPADAGDVDVGGEVVQLSAVGYQTCALLTGGRVRCWGSGSSGGLGYGNTNSIGDNESPASAGDVNVGGSVQALALGGGVCALLEQGKVRCWGNSWPTGAALGYMTPNVIGDDEFPASVGDVNVGAEVIQVATGGAHTCALLRTGSVRCWGVGESGQLGYGNTRTIGDDEPPASAGDVNVGAPVIQLSAGREHTCALLATRRVRCWGAAYRGALGYGPGSNIGDDELPASAGDVPIGGDVRQISAGAGHTCALLTTGKVRCWGSPSSVIPTAGLLGYGRVGIIGNETPASLGDIDVGGEVAQIAAGAGHTCAVLTTGRIRCWGANESGQLGYGNVATIGDDEVPASAGDVVLGF